MLDVETPAPPPPAPPPSKRSVQGIQPGDWISWGLRRAEQETFPGTRRHGVVIRLLANGKLRVRVPGGTCRLAASRASKRAWPQVGQGLHWSANGRIGTVLDVDRVQGKIAIRWLPTATQATSTVAYLIELLGDLRLGDLPAEETRVFVQPAAASLRAMQEGQVYAHVQVADSPSGWSSPPSGWSPISPALPAAFGARCASCGQIACPHMTAAHICDEPLFGHLKRTQHCPGCAAERTCKEASARAWAWPEVRQVLEAATVRPIPLHWSFNAIEGADIAHAGQLRFAVRHSGSWDLRRDVRGQRLLLGGGVAADAQQAKQAVLDCAHELVGHALFA